MKILVFNGSPKKDKSDTMFLTRAFLDGMNGFSQQEITTVDVIDMHIEYCISNIAGGALLARKTGAIAS